MKHQALALLALTSIVLGGSSLPALAKMRPQPTSQVPIDTQAPAKPKVPALTVTVVRQSQSVPNGAAVDVQVSCPTGTITIGGGGEVSPNGLANAYLTASSPLPVGATTPTGWHIIGSNLSGNNLTFTAYALCAQQTNSR